MNLPEPQAVEQRYARRDGARDAQRYSLFADPAALHEQQARLRALTAIWRAHGWATLADKSLLEVGCGAGGNLHDLLRLGAQPQRLTGLELLPERAAAARALLPPSVTIAEGDALAATVAPGSQHVVLAFTLFSSLLDADFRQGLAAAMWRWVAPGGGVLVYDFAFDNPGNADVRGVPVAVVRRLFPQATCHVKRVTLAPPIARRLPAALIAPASVVLWPLRTHRLVWAVKPA